MKVYGYADEHSTLIGYRHCASEHEALACAQDMADRRRAVVEYWLDERDFDGELPASKVVQPTRPA